MWQRYLILIRPREWNCQVTDGFIDVLCDHAGWVLVKDYLMVAVVLLAQNEIYLEKICLIVTNAVSLIMSSLCILMFICRMSSAVCTRNLYIFSLV